MGNSTEVSKWMMFEDWEMFLAERRLILLQEMQRAFVIRYPFSRLMIGQASFNGERPFKPIVKLVFGYTAAVSERTISNLNKVWRIFVGRESLKRHIQKSHTFTKTRLAQGEFFEVLPHFIIDFVLTTNGELNSMVGVDRPVNIEGFFVERKDRSKIRMIRG